jgi:putative ABC transport system permease protein
MTLRDLVKLVLSNLSRMRGRVFMTALGVLIGTMAIVVLVALGLGLQKSATGSLSEFGPLNQITVLPGSVVRAFGGGGTTTTSEEATLTPAALDRFRTIPGVDAVTPYLYVYGSQVKLNRLEGFASLIGVAPTAARGLGFTAAQGSERLGNWTVLAGARAGENFYDPRFPGAQIEPLDLYGETLVMDLERQNAEGDLERRRVRLRVGGVLEERGGQDDSTLFISLDDAEDLNAWISRERVNRARTGYDQAIVVVDDPGRVLEVEAELTDDGYFAYSASSSLQGINLLFAIMQAVFGGIGAIALLVAAIGIANTMTMAILERTREIGLMKAVGATNRDVLSVFLGEAAGIGFLGGLGGVAFGWAAGQVISVLSQVYFAGQGGQPGIIGGPPLALAVETPAWLMVGTLLFATLVGLVSGLYPALRAATLVPVLALKYE